MGIIKPTKQGKTHYIWNISMVFNMFPLNETFDHNLDPGLRIAAVNSCWSCIESFVRECLDEKISREYDKLPLPDNWKFKNTFFQRFRNIFRNKAVVEDEIYSGKISLKTKFSEHIINGKVTWEPLKKISEQIGYPIHSISNESWAFIKHLYNLRNAFMHGSRIRILISNYDGHDDEISLKYNKALKYLNGEGVVNLQRLKSEQKIEEFLNKELTDFIIDKTIIACDEISVLFEGTYQSNLWRKLRIKA